MSGGIDHHVGEVLGEVMHGCYTLMVSQVGIEYGSSHKRAKQLGTIWLHDFCDEFMCGRVCHLRALFNVLVKRGMQGSFNFCMSGHSVWEAHAVGGGEMTCGVFCATLGGAYLWAVCVMV